MAKRLLTKPPGRHPADICVDVIFPGARNPGVAAFGTMKPDTIYRVPLDEAVRLTSKDRPLHHRFDLAAPAAAASQE